MNIRRIALFILPLLIVFCSSVPAIIPKTPTTIDHELDVQVKLDSAHSVSQSITPDGGTLQATAQDGTLYTLTIPKDALLEDLQISLTPVSGIDNLPLSGKGLAAVQLAPEGLNLLEPATLVIQPKTRIPARDLVSFAYLGDGKDLHLFPLVGDPNQTTFQILHFSGYGAGQGDPGTIQQYQPGSPESKAEAQGGAVATDVANNGGSYSDQDKTKICDILGDWYKASVIVDLKAAETDSSSLYAAGGQYMRWLQKNSMFCGKRFDAEVEAANQSLAKGLQHAYHEAVPQCQLKLMYQWSKWAALLSLLTYAPDLTFDPNVLADIKKCQVFEMEIGGTITLPGASPKSFIIQPGTVPMKQTGAGTFEGSNELQGGFEGFAANCSASDQPKWNFTVKAINSDELIHQGSIFEFNVTMTLAWAGTGKCGDVSRAFSSSASLTPPAFQLPAQDGAHYDYKNGGFTEGAIVYTFRDPKGYLDQIGKANWQPH
jgi:hypothetical protein